MKTQQGFIGISFTLLAVLVLAGIGVSSLIITMSQQRLVRNTEQSLQAYYGAEAGVEDALLRLTKSWNIPSPAALGVLGTTVFTTVVDTPEGKQVVAQGDDNSRIRKVEAVFALDSTSPQFFYGAHVGEGGLVMDNNSRVEGNVFSNGSVTGDSGAVITGSIIVAGAHTIEEVTVEGDATADECEDAEVLGTLYANEEDCDYGFFEVLGIPPDAVPLSILPEDIQGWKDEAEAGGVTSGDLEYDGDDTVTMGPQKIEGNLELSNDAILTMTGNLWVTGSVIVKNQAQVKLASSYGSSSGVLVADGSIRVANNSISSGSGTEGSYVMYLSTNTSDTALTVDNNAIADIVYTSAGGLQIANNAALREVTGYKVFVKNNAVIMYEEGLQNAFFSSGPGAGWILKSWKEVE